MQLFKNECLHDTGFPAHDLVFRAPVFAPRYGRHPLRPHRALAASAAGMPDDDAPLWSGLKYDPDPAYGRARWSDLD